MTRPTVSVILVTYNSAQVLPSSLGALEAAFGDTPHEVLVVDNCSADDSVAVATSIRPDATVLKSPGNIGFSRAVNEGARHARGELIMLLNPDAVLEPGAGSHLADTAARTGGIVGPLFLPALGGRGVVSAGIKPTVTAMALHYSGLARLSRRVVGHYAFAHQLREPVEQVDWVSGACMAMPDAVWKSLEGLHERWFMYGEDIDLCVRARTAGVPVSVATAARVDHAVGGSDSSGSLTNNPAWVLNLYDVFQLRLSRNRVHSFAWRATVSSGLAVRAATFAALATVQRSHRTKWSTRAQRFRTYAGAVAPWAAARPVTGPPEPRA